MGFCKRLIEVPVKELRYQDFWFGGDDKEGRSGHCPRRRILVKKNAEFSSLVGEQYISGIQQVGIQPIHLPLVDHGWIVPQLSIYYVAGKKNVQIPGIQFLNGVFEGHPGANGGYVPQ
jgi:hypothetical protein